LRSGEYLSAKMGTPAQRIEILLRELAPRVLGVVTRRSGDFTAAEDAVQEALIAASLQWPKAGVPESPLAWLIQVARRRMTDHIRADSARREREATVLRQTPLEEQVTPGPDVAPPEQDDTLALLFMCCHPVLTAPSAIALTLRAVGGLTTAEIAHAFLVPEPTMAQRISRAKERIKESGVGFQLPEEQERGQRLGAVLHMLYLIFNEGYATSSGPNLQRADLANEAIRLTREVHRLLPEVAEVTGLLALMLLTDARRTARTGPEGELIALEQQDRSRWDRQAIEEGVALLGQALPRGPIGPYQLQAAIAALHDEAARAEDTDWPQILALYEVLKRHSDNPMVNLSHAVAAAMVHGPAHGLELLRGLEQDPRLAAHYRLDAVRAHLLERADDRAGAITHYLKAAGATTSVPERDYLVARAARLSLRTPGDAEEGP